MYKRQYVYCSAGFGESSTDLVFAGNGIVAENGRILRESGRFRLEEQLVVADIDIQRLEFARRRNTSFRMHEGAAENTVIEMEVPEGLRAAALDPMCIRDSLTGPFRRTTPERGGARSRRRPRSETGPGARQDPEQGRARSEEGRRADKKRLYPGQHHTCLLYTSSMSYVYA